MELKHQCGTTYDFFSFLKQAFLFKYNLLSDIEKGMLSTNENEKVRTDSSRFQVEIQISLFFLLLG